MYRIPPPPTYWLTLLAGPGPLHENEVAAFSRSPLGRANTFSFPSLLVTPRISLNVPPCSPSFLALDFTRLLSPIKRLACTPQACLWTGPLLGFFLGPSRSVRLRYPNLTLARPFVAFSRTALSAVADNLFLGVFLTLYCHFDFLFCLFIFF